MKNTPIVFIKINMFIDKKCTTTLVSNIGQKSKKETFTKGNKYKYDALNSCWNNHILMPNIGLQVIFNNEEFYKYFK